MQCLNFGVWEWVEDNTTPHLMAMQQHVENFGRGAVKPSERYPRN